MTKRDEVERAKVVSLTAVSAYPPVSAWEFKALRTEPAFKALLKNATVYIIGQRPLLWFDQVVVADGSITFEISDGVLTPIKCRIEPQRMGLCQPGEVLEVELGFHRDARQEVAPFDGVAALRLWDEEGAFKVWWSPPVFGL